MSTEERTDRPVASKSRGASTSARRRIPLPPLPAFRKESGRQAAADAAQPAAPAGAKSARTVARNKPEEPPTPRTQAQRPAAGVSHEESDLLLGGALDDEFESLLREDDGAPDPPPATPDRKSSKSASPEHDPVREAAAEEKEEERAGAPGADVLNDLVEEIERDLEEEVSRLTRQTQRALPAYRKTIPCSFVPAAKSRVPKKPAPRKDS